MVDNPEFKENHRHDKLGIFRCCVNKAYWNRFSSCYYGFLDEKRMRCNREEIAELCNGNARCSECYFHVTEEDADAGKIPE